MSKTATLSLTLAQLRMIEGMLERQEESGEYYGNRDHYRNRLLVVALHVKGAIAALRDDRQP